LREHKIITLIQEKKRKNGRMVYISGISKYVREIACR